VDLGLLQSISLAVAEARTIDTVLKMIVSGLQEKAGFALARIWLMGNGDICNECRMRQECPSQARCLHLAASAGQSLVDGQQWNRTDGSFRRFPLGIRKVGRVGMTGESVLLNAEDASPISALGPEWAHSEGIQAFAGHPLVFRGEILGVLGVFRREPLGRQLFDWLRLFADHAAWR
jgi:GAF domain-containing protein